MRRNDPSHVVAVSLPARTKGQNGLASTIVPARDIAPPAGGTRVFSSLVPREPLKRPGVGVRPAELGAVSPHAVNDHRHSACHRDDCSLHSRCRAIFIPVCNENIMPGAASGETTRLQRDRMSQLRARAASPSGVVTGGDQPSSRSPAGSATSELERRS
jgi:hypothetical protein